MQYVNKVKIPTFNMPTTAPAGEAAAAGTSGLTAEGMMLYCASQLRFLDDGIAAHMATQQ
ncbi:MAG: hypothetical protein QOI41_2265, partial [Myxococcales bacterium]|nr:hypothetical protein [Myxococcales bacterium]